MSRPDTSSAPPVGALLLGGVVILVAVLSLRSATDDGASETAAPGLTGYWTTEDSRYSDRALEIHSDALVFHTGNRGTSYHALEEVESVQEGGRVAITFRYRGPEGGGELTVYVPAGDSTRMTLQNRPGVIWRRGELP